MRILACKFMQLYAFEDQKGTVFQTRSHFDLY